jgi:hypothetical protein
MWILCTLLIAQTAAAQTRLTVSAGPEFSTEFNQQTAPLALHLNVAADAPAWIRRHVPLEFALGFTGPYPEDHSYPIQIAALDDWPYGHYNHWEPRDRFSEGVRIYLISRRPDTQAPDGVELALGVSNHQIFSRLYNDQGREVSGLRFDTQFRADVAFRTLFLPSHPSGPLLELDLERALEDAGVVDGGWAARFTIGYRFRV